MAVISKSGGMLNETSHMVRKAGLGQSVSVGIGGEYLNATNYNNLLIALQKDPNTKAVLIFEELGSDIEEILKVVNNHTFKKQIYLYIAGQFIERMPKNTSFGHAGAVIDGQSKSYAYWLKRCKNKKNVQILQNYDDIITTLKKDKRLKT